MPSNAHGDGEQRGLRPPPSGERRKNAVEHRSPHQRERNDLGAKRYGAIFAEVADIPAQTGVRQQPIVKPGRRADPQCGGEQQKRRGREQRHENTDDTQHERQTPQGGEEKFHGAKIA